MTILNNPRKKTTFVQQKNESLNTYIVSPYAGVHGATKLTIKAGDSRIDLDGRQVNTLLSVLNTSRKATKRAKVQ